MIIDGRIVDLDVRDPDERRQMTNAVATHMTRQPAFAVDHVAGSLAAAYAVDCLESELADAAAYRWLRDQICKTMADPDSWDGDGSEESVLAEYIRHLAKASHGNCQTCGRRISATEGFEDLGADLQPIVICSECA